MKKIINFLFASLILIGCMANASSVKTTTPTPKGHIIEKSNQEMLELAMDMDDERTHAIYVVIISEPEIVIAKPPKSTP